MSLLSLPPLSAVTGVVQCCHSCQSLLAQGPAASTEAALLLASETPKGSAKVVAATAIDTDTVLAIVLCCTAVDCTPSCTRRSKLYC